MKRLVDKILISLNLIFLIGCSSTEPHSPSQKGFLQKKLDKFLQNEWKSTLKNDENITKKYEDNKSRSFTLQEYVEKSKVYFKKHPSNYEQSNIHKLDKMPIIGK